MGQQGSTAVKKELLAKTSYNPAELDELYREFKRLDKDKSGQLDRTEFAALFNTRMKGSTPEQIDQLFVVCLFYLFLSFFFRARFFPSGAKSKLQRILIFLSHAL